LGYTGALAHVYDFECGCGRGLVSYNCLTE
jgi:hypothetical protein